MPRYDVFLSYTGADRPAVEHIAHKLAEEGLKPFFDRWDLVPGERWIIGLEEALAQSSAFTVFLGPKSGGGAWRTQEVELALARAAQEGSFRIIPVLLPEGDETTLDEISGFLRLRTWADLRGGLDDENAFRRLLAGIRGKPAATAPDGGEPALPYRCMAPAREPFIPRREEHEKLAQALLAGTGRSTIVGITTALQGAGGFGKTALAIEICYDPRIRERYPDGILWAQMREAMDAEERLKRIRDLLRGWIGGDPPAFETVDMAAAHLRFVLEKKRALVVVDDAWQPEDITPFHGLGERSALLVTTRQKDVLPADTIAVSVDAMTPTEAEALLGTKLQGADWRRIRTLSIRLGEWPILLRLVNRHLRELSQKGHSLAEALTEVEEALKTAGPAAFDRQNRDQRNRLVALTIEMSLRLLSDEDLARYSDLVIFPEDEDIPVDVLEQLWSCDLQTVKTVCDRLDNSSLLHRFDRPGGIVRLHDVFRAYLLRRFKAKLAATHQRFLQRCRPLTGQWASLKHEERYLWRNLSHHLIGAEARTELRDLLISLDYLYAKISATDVNSLLLDFGSFGESDDSLQLIRGALRLSSEVLAKNPQELPGQLLARLMDCEQPEIRGLLRRLQGWRDRVWLRPWSSEVVRPGEELVEALRGHSRRVSAVAAIDDRWIISASTDAELRVWDRWTGQTRHVLAGHGGPIYAVAVLDSTSIVSGSGDHTLRVWDWKHGQMQKCLGGLGDGRSSSIYSLVVLNERRVICGGLDGRLTVWDLESETVVQTLEGHSRAVTALVLLPGGRLASASWDRTIRVWSLENGKALKTLRGHQGEINALVDPGDGGLISGSEDGTIREWSVESGEEECRREMKEGITALACLGPETLLAALGTGEILLLRSRQIMESFRGHFDRVGVLVPLGRERFLSGSYDHTIRIWATGRRKGRLGSLQRTGHIAGFGFADADTIISGSPEAGLCLWKFATGELVRVLSPERDTGALLVSGWRAIVTSALGWYFYSLRRPSIPARRAFPRPASPLAQIADGLIAFICFVPHPQPQGVFSEYTTPALQAALGQVRGKSQLYLLREYATPESAIPFYGIEHTVIDGIEHVAPLSRGRIVCASAQALKVWTFTKRGAETTRQRLEGLSGVSALETLDGDLVVYGTRDALVGLWDPEGKKPSLVFRGHADEITALRSLGGESFASASRDGALCLWSIGQEKPVAQFHLESAAIALMVHKGSRRLAAADRWGQIHLFDIVDPASAEMATEKAGRWASIRRFFSTRSVHRRLSGE